MVRPTRGRSGALAAAATVVAILSALVTAGGSVGATSPLPIMPLGDSITDGFNIPGGYRIDLEDDLVAAGLPPDFVGTLQNGPAALADRNHEGHSGWRIDEVHASVDGWLTTYQPEVVLLLIGTNDVLQDYQVSTAPGRLAALLDRIHAVRPTTKLLLSTIPPLANAADNAQAATYNDAIPGLVQARASQGRPISFVDAGRRLTLSHLADGVHPNASGYSSLADSWRDGIVAAVGANAPPTVSLSAPADGASFPAGTTVALAATAADSDGQVSKVEFYAGQTKLGEDLSAPYTHSWTNPTSGSHQLTARATDNQGASTTSTSRTITVAAAPGERTLYRAINLGGPSLTIDGRLWEAGNAVNVSAGPVSFENQSSVLDPPTDTERARMIRSAVWGSSLTTVRITGIPTATYEVYLTVWEDTASATFDIRLDGTVVRSGYQSGNAGRWARLGPWPVSLTDGSLDLSAGPDANLSGIELWQVAAGGPGNAPPTVSLSAPADGASFPAGTTVALAATAADSDGQVSKVEFYAGQTKLGEDLSAPYTHSWTNPTSGSHQLTARAIDNQGASTTSTSRTITVNAPTGGETLYRAINLGGPSLTIDGRLWEAGNAANVSAGPVSFENQSIGLDPATDSERARMIRSSVWGSSLSTVRLSAVPNGSYHVYLTVWEDTSSTTFDIRLEGILVRSGYQSGSAGRWERLGPWPVTISDGTLDLDAGPDANLSGIELWQTGTPPPPNSPPTVALTAPAEGASFGQGTPIGLAATAADGDGQVSKVEFYAGQTKLGEDLSAPYTHSWATANPGTHQLTARAIDNQGASTTSTSRTIAVTGTNSPPQAAAKAVTTTAGAGVEVVLEGTDGESCELTFEVTASPSHGSLGSIAAQTCTPGAPNRDTGRVTYAPAAGYVGQDSFSYRVSDGTAASASVAVTIRIDPAPGGGVLSVGDLDGQAWTTGKNWSASVTIAAVDAGAASVAGVSVSGTWAAGGSASCTTDATGRCTVTRSPIHKNTASARFAVTQLTKTSFSYDPTRNRDPDGDSDGTAITVVRP